MKTRADFLIEDLIERTRRNMNAAEELRSLPPIKLKTKPAPQKWNAVECIAHLNRYGDFYLPEFTAVISKSKHPAEALFKSGLLGNYFAKSVMAKEKLNKMKTFKVMNPADSGVEITELQVFIDQQKSLLSLLEKSRKVSLNKNKTAISISNWIRLKLGDTYRVVIYHNERHIVQARRAAGLL